MPAAEDDLILLQDAAREAGEIALRYWRGDFRTWDKGDGAGPVTEADLAVNAHLERRLRGARPDYGWLSEESPEDPRRATAARVFVIDPIDGTRAFIAGVPVWGTLIGLYRNGEAVMGLVDQPFTGERYFADGAVSRYAGPEGGRVLSTRPCENLSDAILFTTSPHLFKDWEVERFQSVQDKVKLFRYGVDCYAYCLLAAGHVDLVIESGLKPYDIVALIPIIEGAGGIVTSWDGGSAAQGGTILAAGNKALHQAALALLAG